MKFKKTILIFALLIVAFYGICGACAGDVNDTMVAEQNQLENEVIGQSIDVAGEDALNASCDGDDTMGVNLEENKEVLGAEFFMSLQLEIYKTGDGTLKLKHDYEYNPNNLMDKPLKKIEITKSITIDGDRHTIDADGKIQIFEIETDYVTLQNINFKNSYSSAIHCSEGVTRLKVINCTFTNTVGSAIMFEKYANYCIISGNEFKNNDPKTSSWCAILFRGKANSCSMYGNYFHDNKAYYASGIQFWGDVKDCWIEDEFIGKDGSSSETGGAISFFGKVTGTTVKGHFENNVANYGGAIYFADDVSDCEIIASFLYNGVEVNDKSDEAIGGAIFFNATVSDTTIDSKFIENHARGDDGWAGAIWFSESVNNIKIYGEFTGNTATKAGGALYFINDLQNSLISAKFEDNKAFGEGAGAIFMNNISNTTITNEFRRNSASGSGGAIYAIGISDSTISAKFVNNNALNGYGGAILMETVSNTTITNQFGRNSASLNGGAVYAGNITDSAISAKFEDNNAREGVGGAVFADRILNTDITNEFRSNSASKRGGAIFTNSMDDSTICAEFIENNVTGNSSFGAAIFFKGSNCSISNCIFINNSAAYGVVYYGGCENAYSRIKINNNIFIDYCIEIFFYMNDHTSNADYNWFANNGTDYEQYPQIVNVPAETWLFMNATADYSSFSSSNSVDVVFELHLYNSTSGEISEYDNAPFKNVDLTITATGGNVSKSIAKLEERIRFIPPANKELSNVTAQIEKTFQAIKINAKGDFDILQDLINNAVSSVIYLERSYEYNILDTITDGIVINKTLSINGNGFTIDAKGKSRIFNVTCSNVEIKEIIFRNGKTTGNGAALLIGGNNNSVSSCAFVDNSAGDGIVYFDTAGGVYSNLTINNNIFIGNDCFDISFDKRDDMSNADFNWFANNATNYDAQPKINNVNVNNWLFLNSTANCSSIFRLDTVNVLFYLDLYNPSSAKISKYDNSPFEILYLTITPARGSVDKSFAKLGDTVEFTATRGGNASVTAQIGNAYQTIGFSVINGEFGMLQDLILDSTSSVINLTRNYTYSKEDRITEGILTGNVVIINGNGYTIDAKGKSRIFNVTSDNVIINNINFLNANSTVGGAVYFENNGNVVNCNFVNNSASYLGGAVYFAEQGSIENCNFTQNHVNLYNRRGGGGAVYFYRNGNVANCNFDNNHGTSDKFLEGGAIRFLRTGTVTNCNFTNNNASNDGGAVYFGEKGILSDCNFINNTGSMGGAVYFETDGILTDCNFDRNNAASHMGGAIYISVSGNVINSNFTNNTAYQGGAIYVFPNSYANVINCNFADNSVCAIFGSAKGDVTNCNFTNNKAGSKYGGAINVGDCKVRDSNFINNSALGGGAIFFSGDSDVVNCNFNGNKADIGSAIYFNRPGATVSNSIFLNNRANVTFAPLEIMLNENNIEITFRGNNNYINAIFAGNTINFSNVTYWGAKGIANTDDSTPVLSLKEAGQNISVGIIVNGVPVFKDVKLTDDEGRIVLNEKVNGKYFIIARHDEDSYYKEAEKILTNMDFHVNVNEIETTNKTVNITAESNIIKNEIIPGKLVFILPNGDEINATYVSDGTWWAIHTFVSCGKYEIGASYIGLEGVAVKNATITINKVNSTINIDDIVMEYGKSVNVTVKTEGATAVTAKIGEDDVGVVNNYTVPISGLNVGNYTLTVTTVPDEDHYTVSKTAKITVNRANSTVAIDDIVFDYNSTGSAIISAEGVTGITACIVGHDEAIVNITGNTITISNLTVGNYTLSVTTIPDANHNPVSKTFNVTVKKSDSTLTVSDIAFDYGASGSASVSYTGARGIMASVVNQPKAVVYVDVERIEVSGLDAGTYVLSVTTLVDYYHNSVTVNATITVNRTNSTLTVSDVEMDYGEDKNITVKAVNATGITAKIDGVYLSVDGFTIPISGLDAGTHILSVRTVVDANHKSVSKNATVTVNKVNSTLTVGDVKLEYGEVKNVTVTAEGATGITAKIDGVNVSVDGFTIPVSGLDAGTHTLAVTTIADKNHKSVTETATITVNRVNSTLTVDDVELAYGEGKNVTITADGVTGITAKIDGENVTVDGFTVPVSGLDVGTHTLTVTSIADKNHKSVTQTAKVTVNKANSTLTVDDVELDYGESKNVTVTADGATGITAKIDGENVTVEGYTILVSGLAIGTHTLTVTTIADDNHNPVTKTASITVNKINSTLTVDDFDLDYGESKNVTVTADGAIGITAKIDDVNVSVEGYAIPVFGLDAGTHTLSVTTLVDDSHNPVTKTSTITVNKINSTLTVDDVELDYGESKNITVTVEGATGVTAMIDDGNVSVVGFTIEISSLDAGTHTLSVTTIADKNHNSVTKTAAITVNKINSTLSVDDIELDYGESKNVTVTADGATAITAKIDDVNVSADGFTIPVSGLDAGTHTLSVTTIADKNHNSVSKTAKITVNKVNSTLTLDDVELDYGESKNITVIADGVTGITAKIDDVNVTVDGFTIEIYGLDAGTYTLTVAAVPDANHNPVTKTAKITVNKVNSTLSVEDMSFDYGLSGSTTVEFTGARGVTAAVNDPNAVVQVNGKTIIVSNLTAGSYILSVTTVPDDNHNAVTETAAVTVLKQNSTAEISMPENVTAGKNSTVSVMLSDDATGNVTVKVDGELIDTAELVNGSASLEIPSLSAGNHTVEVSYSGDGKYNPISETKELSVSKQDTTPEITLPSEISFGQNSTLEVTLPGDAGGNVTLVVDGDAVDTVEVIDGSASVELPSLAAGNHTAEVIYSGDDKYKSSSKTTIITVERDSTNLTAENVAKVYKAGYNLVVTLTDSHENPLANAVVTVVLDDAKNYTTDADGQIKISNLIPKTYNAKITFTGNENYTGSDAEVKVVVKKAAPKITAKNKKYKSAAKTKKYSITLKDSKGKAIKKAKVTLKVAGKTYKATTNSKGKATFKITKLNSKGTFKAKITYKGNKYYKKVTKNAKITVRSLFKTVSRGSPDSVMVKKIQRALKSNGFYRSAYGHYLKVDGIYEQWTESAVRQFQLSHGLKVTGSVDEKTAVKLGII